MPESPLPQCFWEQLPLAACPRLCCLELSLPGAVSLAPCLRATQDSHSHPTRSVLSSALLHPPGSTALPRAILVCAGPKEQLRKVLTRAGFSCLLQTSNMNSSFPPPTQPSRPWAPLVPHTATSHPCGCAWEQRAAMPSPLMVWQGSPPLEHLLLLCITETLRVFLTHPVNCQMYPIEEVHPGIAEVVEGGPWILQRV